jgi:hypothetical protein
MSEKHKKFSVDEGTPNTTADWYIRYTPVGKTVDEKGTITFGMSIPLLQATEFVGNPDEFMQTVAVALNEYESEDRIDLIKSLISTLNVMKPVVEREISRVLSTVSSDEGYSRLSQDPTFSRLKGSIEDSYALIAKAREMGIGDQVEQAQQDGQDVKELKPA